MTSMIEKVARAIAAAQWKVGGDDSFDASGAYDLINNAGRFAADQMARAAIKAIPLEQLIAAAYVRGVEWNEENPLDREYRFKAAFDYADKTLTVALAEEPANDE